MSDYLSFEIQVEILRRLPVKSLIQFRSVSKSWKSLIDSADFIARYSRQQQHLLVRYEDNDSEQKYVSVADDETSPQQKVSLTIPVSVMMLEDSITVGSSNGLLCFYGDYKDGCDGPISGRGRAVVWNPSIRKAVAVVVPNVADGKSYETVVGFGVCHETTDPKIVKITTIKRWTDMKSVSCIPRQVEVFTLSTGTWRTPYSCSNLPRTSIRFLRTPEVVDGCLYWLAIDKITMNSGPRYSQLIHLIISFDITSEKFREINLPNSLADPVVCDLSIYKRMESLVVLESGVEANELVSHVWIMEDGVPKSFTKLLTINAHIPYVTGFRKTGEPIIKIIPDISESAGSLAVYEPYSKSINSIGVNGRHFTFFVCSYVETLLLL